MPFVKGVLNDAAWTLQKRSILPSGSACNWATMFMGVGPEAHGFVDWNTSSPVFLQTETMNDGFFPNVFSITEIFDKLALETSVPSIYAIP